MWLTPKTFKKVSGCTWTLLYSNVPKCCCHHRLSSQTTVHIYDKFNPEYRKTLTFKTLQFNSCVSMVQMNWSSNTKATNGTLVSKYHRRDLLRSKDGEGLTWVPHLASRLSCPTSFKPPCVFKINLHTSHLCKVPIFWNNHDNINFQTSVYFLNCMLSPSHFRYLAELYCFIKGPLEQNQHI